MSTAKQPNLFEVFGRSQSTVVPAVNEEALTKFVDVLTESGEEVGKVILLRSPRAGYGKSLLLHAVSNRLSESFRFLAVEPSGGGRVDGEVVLESVVRQLSEVLPASGGLTEFDLFARRLLALGLKPLLISGEIPSHDREGALFAIENRPIETFDFHHQQAATAHWTQSNFEVLGPRLTSELSELSGCSLRGCAYWVDLLFRYATTPPEKVERTRHFTEAIFGDVRGQSSLAEERLQSLLSLLGLHEPIVLVFDETEGLSNQPEAGLRIAAFIVQLRQACPALTVVMSLNDDVWETGLSPLMPGGLEDRLTEFEVVLGTLSRADAESLLRNRFGDNAAMISKEMKWPEPIFARAVLKEASKKARALGSRGVSRGSQSSFALENPNPIMPPPLQASSVEDTAGKDFQEKAERVLEPSSSFDAEAPAAFEAPVETASAEPPVEKATAPVEAPAFEAKPAESTVDPFAEPEVALAAPAVAVTPAVTSVTEQVKPSAPVEKAAPTPEPSTSSPFAIVPEKMVQAEAAAPTTPEKSPFDAVEESPAAEPQKASGGWSPESAVEHFAAGQASSPAPAEAPSSETTSTSVPAEKSPFEILNEEKERLAATAQSVQPSQPAIQKETARVAESSPFVVSETPEPKSQPEPEPTPAAAAQPQPAAASPFSVAAEKAEPAAPATAQQTARVEVSAPEPVKASVPEVKSAPVAVVQPQTAFVEKVAEAPARQPSPVSESPFTAAASVPAQAQPSAPAPAAAPAQVSAPAPAQASSPFAQVATPATQPVAENASGGQESSEVEELLSQFKKRFGQSGS